MSEQLMYETFNQALMTVGECQHAIRSEMVPALVMILFAVIIIGGIAFYHIHKFIKLKQFIKDNKLEKKYQEYVNDNRGL
jgi:hypothetical protein